MENHPTPENIAQPPLNEAPHALQRVEQRLNALEIKASFTEDLLEPLDAVVIRQQQQIDLLIREVTALRQPVASHSTDSPRSLRDDMPPHF